jgi:SOS-response transcriptional repressor LexA
MIETTIMAHHLQIQNIIHLQTSQNPISKHEMKNINTKRDKKNLHKNIRILQNKKMVCFGMSNYQK